MTALQVSIGATNDLVDAPRDAIGHPSKPIPAGRVTVGEARSVAGAAAIVGVALSLSLGPAMAAQVAVVLAIGYGYDLVLKGTRWSWLPFAVGIPILPVFGWLGTAGRLPGSFAVLVPAAVAAGASLALANSLVDVEGDAASGADSPAVAWGAARTRSAAATLAAIVAVAAVVTALASGVSPAVVAGVGVAGATSVLATTGLGGTRRASRERAWEAQALATAGVAVAWLLGLASVGGLG
jgi:4-hydroxybenzoate polyprenyltransferase